MSSVLDEAEVPGDRPIMVTIVGDAGRGKSSLAATFPQPIVMRFEDGLQRVPAGIRPRALPLIVEETQVWEQLNALLRDPHDYQTLIIDSVSAADRFFTEAILKNDKANSLQQACGGYGAGKEVLAGKHGRIRKGCGMLASRRGMNIVFLAHADTIRIEPPNEDAYMSYALKMDKKSQPFYIDDVDLVGFIKLDAVAIGDEGERKKMVSDGSRVLITYVTAENVSKNGVGITKPLPVKLGENPLAPFFPQLQQQKNKEPAQ